jgi:hypothetical protein
MRLYTFEAKKGRQLIGAEVAGRLIDLNVAHAARVGRRAAVLANSMLELPGEVTNSYSRYNAQYADAVLSGARGGEGSSFRPLCAGRAITALRWPDQS